MSAEINDTRIPPGALLKPRLPTWVMLAAAGATLLVVVINMAMPQPAAPVAPTVPAAPAPRQPVQRLSQIMPVPEPPRPEMPAPAPQSIGYGGPAYAAPDPIEADRKRRDYESLFAENVVGRRQEPQSPVAQTLAPPTTGTPTATTPKPADVSSSIQPPSGLVLLEGTVIEAVLTNRLEGSRDGPVNAMVTTDVYVGRTRVIPKGSRILGTAKGVQDLDEERLAIGFHRVLLPDGTSISLDKDIPGLDQAGAQGVKDQVNRHYWSTFGAAAAVGILSGLGQFMTGYGYGYGGQRDSTVIVTGATDDVAQAMAMTLRHFLNRRPQIVVREGHRVRVYLTSDVTIPEGVGR